MIPLFFLNFIKGISLNNVMIFLATAAVAFAVWQGAGFVKDKIAADIAVVRLEQQIEDQNEAMQVLKLAAAQRESAVAAADAARVELEDLQTAYDEIVRDSDTVKDEDNGEIAPVLRRTLDALGRM